MLTWRGAYCMQFIYQPSADETEQWKHRGDCDTSRRLVQIYRNHFQMFNICGCFIVSLHVHLYFCIDEMRAHPEPASEGEQHRRCHDVKAVLQASGNNIFECLFWKALLVTTSFHRCNLSTQLTVHLNEVEVCRKYVRHPRRSQ